MPIADKMVKMVDNASMIRKMFEEGAQLKAQHGPENVYDFSLGNPDVPSPPEFKKVLRELAGDDSLNHGYMPSPGHPHVRQAVADYMSSEHSVEFTSDLIIMTVGAAGALNDILKALINPGEEILTPSPYFVGYDQYSFIAGAMLKTAPSDDNFHLDLSAIKTAISEKTRVMLINSPNNPTGAIYSAQELADLAKVLDQASRKFGRRIYLVSDEPYRKIAYDMAVPSVFQAYPHTIIVSSYSKELSLAGERIGYLVIHPDAEDAGLVYGAAAVANTMYCVNAPSLIQQAIARLQGITVDVSIYRRRRDMLCQGLAEAGYDFKVPEGAFYLFPKSPIPDDIEFINRLKAELILAVPGTGFGAPGYFRLSYAVPDATIAGSFEGFKRALEGF
ncbi:aspartate aminotransferase [Alkalispirochaeta odontotermitis]|nr:aspartate aminotransferase [Alkalispirochaeta odontotermitis]CAB1080141.1 Biosynthetic Aromatic amino acid aminotransferase alpha (EC @ Aspartate aminotransferase (EC [Olavius algarvensis Delta 1 endosymbiont]